ncbi:MAG TPA: FtsX-like permease family protein [Candidatus Limnocylindrales bacterium]|nr:FtsX-like permease family protein [Candidatus Limnocylindrales bacterium]
MNAPFELFVANRYLRAHRGERAISIITLISVVGVAAGVMALVIALAVTNGFRSTLQRNLLGAMADINVMNKMNLYGIDNWETLAASIRKVPHVVAVSPALYTPVMLSGAVTPTVVILKGIDVKQGLAVSDTLRHLKAGSLDRLRDADAKPPGLIVGKPLMEETGITLDSNIKVVSPEGELTPFGPQPAIRLFRVSGIYETGFYDIDDHWAYASIPAVQKALSLNDVINQLEIKVDNIDRAPDIAKDIERVTGSRYTTTTWQEQNRQLFSALHMERLVTVIVISLIELVAALNIFITLVMLVMEKYRDIAVLMSMGARHQQIRRIFMMQGVLIGVVGSGIGLALGYSLSYFANTYRWIPLQQSVYSMSFVPFEAHWIDGLWIAALAVLVSFLATLYPARNATRIAPAEVLRYE